MFGEYNARCVPGNFAVRLRDIARLVDCHPVGNAIAQRLVHHPGIISKSLAGICLKPALVALEQREGHIAVIQRSERTDPGFQELIDQTRIEIDSPLLDTTAALGYNS